MKEVFVSLSCLSYSLTKESEEKEKDSGQSLLDRDTLLTRRIFAPPSQLIFTVEAKVSLSKPSSHSISQEKSLPGLSDLREPKDSSSAS